MGAEGGYLDRQCLHKRADEPFNIPQVMLAHAPPMEMLQVAGEGWEFLARRRRSCVKPVPKAGDIKETLDFIGASEGIRTLDIHLGKVTLYQTELRSLDQRFQKITNRGPKGKR